MRSSSSPAVQRSGGVGRPAPSALLAGLLALAGGPCGGSFLEGEVVGGFNESLVGGVGVEPFGLRLVLTLQPTNHAQHLTLSTQVGWPLLAVLLSMRM